MVWSLFLFKHRPLLCSRFVVDWRCLVAGCPPALEKLFLGSNAPTRWEDVERGVDYLVGSGGWFFGVGFIVIDGHCSFVVDRFDCDHGIL